MNPNYRTLNNDIGMVQRTNNGWDLWFDNGDLVKAEDFHSLQVGIIIACLTSWNYMNRYGNPTYEVFGNRAYELLKANKGSMVAYKIQQYFIECLKRMRRVYEIVYLNVSEVPSQPYTYFVEFEVISINNQLVDGSFTVSTDASKSTSYIDYETYMPYASNENPLVIDLWLKNEYGGGLEGEVLYMYLQKGDNDYVFMGVVGKTDETGYLRVTYEPVKVGNEWMDSINGGMKPSTFSMEDVNAIYFDFHGNTTYNPSTSKRTIFKTELYSYAIEFTSEGIATNVPHATLHLKLTRTSLKDNTTENVVGEAVTIIGSDGKIYNAVTDDEGEASVNVAISETTTFATYYNNSEDTTTVTLVKQTPTVNLHTNVSSMHVGEHLEAIALVKDEFNDYVEGLEVTFKKGNDVIGTARTSGNGVATLTINGFGVGEHTITATTESTDFYHSVTSTGATVTIAKHPVTLELSMEESTVIVDNYVQVFASVTEDGSNLYGLDVVFKDENDNVLGTGTANNGVASLLTDALGVGEHTITATITENDLYLGATDNISCTIIDHDYELSFNATQTRIGIESESRASCDYELSLQLTDNDVVVNKLNENMGSLVVASEETGDSWVITGNIPSTLSSTNKSVPWGESVTFTATFGEEVETKQMALPVWYDSASIDSLSYYVGQYVHVPSPFPVYNQTTSPQYCRYAWSDYVTSRRFNTTDTSISNGWAYGTYPSDYKTRYVAEVPLKLQIIDNTDVFYNQGVVISVGLHSKGIYDTIDLYAGDSIDVDLDVDDYITIYFTSSNQTLNYNVYLKQDPELRTQYSTNNEYRFSVDKYYKDSFVGWKVPNTTGKDNIKVSCKAKFTTSNLYNQLLIGLTDSDTSSNTFDIFRIRGDEVVDYTKTIDSPIWSESNVAEFIGEWVTVEFTRQGNIALCKVYDDENNLLASTIQTTNTYTNPHIFIGVNGLYPTQVSVKDILVEESEKYYYFKDNASSNNASTLFGSSISLRNNGTGTVSYMSNSPPFYLISNTKANAESFIPYVQLNGLSNQSFKITVKSSLNNTTYNACLMGLYYYEDNNNWGGVKGAIHEQWVSDKTNGTFSEKKYLTGESIDSNQIWHEFIYDAIDNLLIITGYRGNYMVNRSAMQIPIALDSNVKWGTTTTWSSNDKHRVYEISAEPYYKKHEKINTELGVYFDEYHGICWVELWLESETNEKLYNREIKLYEGNTLIDTLYTDEYGYAESDGWDSTQSYTIRAVYEGDLIYNGSEGTDSW